MLKIEMHAIASSALITYSLRPKLVFILAFLDATFAMDLDYAS
jgi:hypothetical protein